MMIVVRGPNAVQSRQDDFVLSAWGMEMESSLTGRRIRASAK
jgi:hypothetical protein